VEVFIDVCISKFFDSKGLEKIIFNLKILPDLLIKLPSFVILVLGINTIRGIKSSCGYFSTDFSTSHSYPWLTIIRGMLLISFGIILVLFSKEKKKKGLLFINFIVE